MLCNFETLLETRYLFQLHRYWVYINEMIAICGYFKAAHTSLNKLTWTISILLERFQRIYYTVHNFIRQVVRNFWQGIILKFT